MLDENPCLLFMVFHNEMDEYPCLLLMVFHYMNHKYFVVLKSSVFGDTTCVSCQNMVVTLDFVLMDQLN